MNSPVKICKVLPELRSSVPMEWGSITSLCGYVHPLENS